MEVWQPYSRERKIKRCDGYVIIIPEKDKEDTVPVFCSVCEIRLLTRDDEEAYKKFACCSACADTWAYSRRDEWINGWRPNSDQINASVQKRNFVNKNITFE